MTRRRYYFLQACSEATRRARGRMGGPAPTPTPTPAATPALARPSVRLPVRPLPLAATRRALAGAAASEFN